MPLRRLSWPRCSGLILGAVSLSGPREFSRREKADAPPSAVVVLARGSARRGRPALAVLARASRRRGLQSRTARRKREVEQGLRVNPSVLALLDVRLVVFLVAAGREASVSVSVWVWVAVVAAVLVALLLLLLTVGTPNRRRARKREEAERLRREAEERLRSAAGREATASQEQAAAERERLAAREMLQEADAVDPDLPAGAGKVNGPRSVGAVDEAS